MTTEPKLFASVTPDTKSPDPFAPENLRLSQQFGETAGVKKLLTVVPVKKPNAQTFVRARPGAEWQADVAILDVKDADREQFLVTSAVSGELAGEVVNKTLRLAITRQGTLFFWPIRLPMPDGKDSDWWRSEREAATLAESSWVRVKADMALGANQIYLAADKLCEPEWPADLDFWALVKIAFRDHLVDTLDHPAVKRLRGQL